MSRRFLFTMLITISGTVAIGVTTQAAGDPKGSSDRMTVVGCLSSTTPQISPAKGETVVPTFTVTNTGADRVVPTAGTTGPSNSGSATFLLDVGNFLHKISNDQDRLYPTDYKKLTPDVGHKVEIVGTVYGQKNGVARDVGSTRSSLPELQVESIKVLAATCSQ